MRLTAVTIRVVELTENHVHDMLRIMQTYYHNVTQDQFVKDLQEKDWVILLWEGGSIRGFSIQMLFSHDIEGQQTQVIFSGDTIIGKSHWGSLALPVAWGRLMLSILKE